MYSIIKNELVKIFKSKRIYFFMGILFILALVPCVGNLIFNKGNYDPEVSGQMLPYSMLMMYLQVILPIFITILVSDIYTEEYVNGTLKLQMIHPISRGRLLFSKVIALAITLLAMLLFSMISGYVLGTIFFGWGDLFKIGTTVYFSGSGLLLTISSYLISVFPLIGFGMLILLISMNMNSSGAAVGTGIGVYFILTYINRLFESASPYMITNYFDIHTLFIKGFDIASFLPYLKVISIYGIGSYIVCHFLFTKKDILY